MGNKLPGGASSLWGLGVGPRCGTCRGEAEGAAALRDLLRLRDGGAAPSSAGARVTSTVTSRLRLCQELLVWSLNGLNRGRWSTKELEDV